MAQEDKCTLREYQIELLHKIREQDSSILFLPTGSGKTFIAVWLIKSLASDLKKPIVEGGKRSFFLVTTVQLVEQQTKVFRTAGFEVAPLTGDIGVDYFTADVWRALENTFDIFVMTSQIYLNALIHGYLEIQNANILIFDECHNATGKHPMAEIMSRHRSCNSSCRPKVLGLSATLFNANLKIKDFDKKLLDLETVFSGRIITSKDCKLIRKNFSTKPEERVEYFPKCCIPTLLMENLKRLRDEAVKILELVKLKDSISVINIHEQQLHIPGENQEKLFKNTFRDIVIHIEEYGIYFGFEVCRLYLIQLYRYMFTSDDERFTNVILHTISIVQIMKKLLLFEIEKTGPVDVLSTIETTSTRKLQYLFKYLRNVTSTDRCLIFVKKKMTAKSLYKLLRLYSETDPKTKYVKVDFIVGSDNNPLRNTREGFFHNKEKSQITKNFKKGEINVLIATSILEEGIDIQSCNTVIMFDVFETFRSYVQSKGRARQKGARFITLYDGVKRIESTIMEYKELDSYLDRIIDRKAISSDDDNDDEDDELTYSTNIVTIKSSQAVPLIYRYCNTLPHDVFTTLQPQWIYNKIQCRCKIKLPLNSPIRDFIQGPKRHNKRSAKRAVALVAVEKLHKANVLDDRLLPIKIPLSVQNRGYWFPHWNEKGVDDGTKKEVEYEMKVADFLTNVRPLPNEKVYLHVFTTETKYKDPLIFRQQYCNNLMQENYYYGILTSKPLPRVCEFPVYSDLGRIKVTVLNNVDAFMLSKNEIREISLFHRHLMMNVLEVVRECFVYDTEGRNSGYFIVPVKKSKSSFKLIWSVIRKKIESVVKPTEEEIKSQNYKDGYLGSVVTPWYDISKLRNYYIVIDDQTELLLESDFTDSKFKTFAEYFKVKYQLEATRPGQPLLEVRRISQNLNGIIPRPVSGSTKNRKRNKDFPVHLPPEFCQKMALPSCIWYKSIILPSVLHRLHSLLLAEELRQKIVIEAGIGSLDFTGDGNDTELFFISPDPVTKGTLQKPKKKLIKTRRSVMETNENVDDELPKDIERTININLQDIKNYVEYVETPLFGTTSTKNLETTSSSLNHPIVGALQKSVLYKIEFEELPALLTLRKYPIIHGPKSHEILEALTLKGAQDSINMERLETLGDSYLKYMVSIFIFKKEKLLDEGGLSILKGELVSNKYLFHCAKKRGIQSYIKSIKFSGRKFWHPSGFIIPRCLEQNMNMITPISALLSLKIPNHERFSGDLSLDTIDNLTTSLGDRIMEIEEKDTESEQLTKFLSGKHVMAHKSISDTVEALIGVYLRTSGIEGAFSVMKYFGILSHENIETIHKDLPMTHSSDNIENILPSFDEIEQIVGYKFKKKAYILEAITHPSFSFNNITDCYQKLEFVGDAVLDFLITSYIYQYCGLLNPGQLTDLRSSLVNNTTFGALAVRLGLHKYMLYHCKSLMDAIQSFVEYQENNNFEIHGNKLLRLIGEEDTIIAKEVDVPKALGDIFESLAGAIYLDSGCQLDEVWRIYYNIMKGEIEKFSQNIPINPVRALYEHPVKVEFIKPQEAEDLNSKVLLYVTKDKVRTLYRGTGDNSNAARRAAAKQALKDLNYNDFVI